MRNLLKFIVRYYFVLLFLAIESFSLFLLIQYNYYQRSTFINSANRISGNIYTKVSVVTDYFSLSNANEELSAQNMLLLNRNKSAYKSNNVKLVEIYDSIYSQQYEYRIAKIINNSINKQNNYLTLNKGSKHGIKPEMAVVGPKGVVGIIRHVSRNFSTVIPILNSNLRISGRFKKNNYFGSVRWDGKNYREVSLTDIPNHVAINIGDTIITSGFSTIFPEGIKIGIVSGVEEKVSGNFHNLTINLSEDFKNLSYVYVIENLLKEELTELEKLNQE